MRFPSSFIRPIKIGRCCFDEAREFYLLHTELNFEDDLLEYLKDGYVFSGPTFFALARIHNIAPEDTNLVQPAWFIRCAVGDLLDLLRQMPVHFEFMVWCRNNEEHGQKLRQWKTTEVFRLAMLLGQQQRPVRVEQCTDIVSTPAQQRKVQVN